MTTEESLTEALAAYAHEAWAGWMKYQVDKCSEVVPGSVVPRITWEPELMTRWYRQMHTRYEDLPEQERESDRAEARRILEVMRQHAPVPSPPVAVEEEVRTFEGELAALINRYSIENESNTPDFILAQYVRGCLTVFAGVTMLRERWYGVQLEPGQSSPATRCQARSEGGAQCLHYLGHQSDHLFREDTAPVWEDLKPPPPMMTEEQGAVIVSALMARLGMDKLELTAAELEEAHCTIHVTRDPTVHGVQLVVTK